jgi:hypothetical protein
MDGCGPCRAQLPWIGQLYRWWCICKGRLIESRRNNTRMSKEMKRPRPGGDSVVTVCCSKRSAYQSHHVQVP